MALLGRKVALKRERGERTTRFAEHTLLSYHPAAILRATEPRRAAELFDALVEDLRRAGELASLRLTGASGCAYNAPAALSAQRRIDFFWSERGDKPGLTLPPRGARDL